MLKAKAGFFLFRASHIHRRPDFHGPVQNFSEILALPLPAFGSAPKCIL